MAQRLLLSRHASVARAAALPSVQQILKYCVFDSLHSSPINAHPVLAGSCSPAEHIRCRSHVGSCPCFAGRHSLCTQDTAGGARKVGPHSLATILRHPALCPAPARAHTATSNALGAALASPTTRAAGAQRAKCMQPSYLCAAYQSPGHSLTFLQRQRRIRALRFYKGRVVLARPAGITHACLSLSLPNRYGL